MGEHKVSSPIRSASAPASIEEQWAARYGPLVAEQLDPDRRYTLIRIGAAEFAYTDHERYLRALGRAWEIGLCPDPLPSAYGRDLPGVAPNLQGVDLDLADLSTADVEPPARRFS